jgi:hypothetical protein
LDVFIFESCSLKNIAMKPCAIAASNLGTTAALDVASGVARMEKSEKRREGE